ICGQFPGTFLFDPLDNLAKLEEVAPAILPALTPPRLQYFERGPLNSELPGRPTSKRVRYASTLAPARLPSFFGDSHRRGFVFDRGFRDILPAERFYARI